MSTASLGSRGPLPFIAAAALLVVLALILSADPGPLPGDRAAADLAEAIRGAWLTERVERLTDLGSGYLIWPLVALTALALAANRRWVEFTQILVAVAIVVIAIPELKDAVGRPRPPDPIGTASGFAFPSGHAAQAAWYVFLALIVVRLAPELRRPGLLIGAATLFCVLIGLSRVYLGVHYFSDVIGGWALALAAFTLWPVVERARGRLRHNLDSD